MVARAFYLAATLALSAMGGCGEAAMTAEALEWSGWERREGLGLRFALPPGRDLEEAEGYLVLANPAAYRAADQIEIHLTAVPSGRAGDGEIIDRGESPAPYQVRERPGGSGGKNYTLATSREVDGRTIALLAIVESEGGVPAFGEAWAVWESLGPAD